MRGKLSGLEGKVSLRQQYDELSDDDREHLPERLRELHEDLRLDVAHPDAQRRLPLPSRQRRQPGSERLADERAVVDDQSDHDSPEGPGRGDEQDEEHHQQHRHAAEELQQPGGRDAQPGVRGTANEREHDPEKDRADGAETAF